MRTITIEVRCDFDDPAKDRIMIQAAREAAKVLLATVALVADKRKPQVKLETGDMFVANHEIDLLSDEEIDEGMAVDAEVAQQVTQQEDGQ